MKGNDPAIELMVEALSKDPTRAVLVRGYHYRVASIRPREPYSTVDITPLFGLRDYLAKVAGWHSPENHSVFVFDFEGQRHAVLFSDYHARFGREEDVFERSLD